MAKVRLATEELRNALSQLRKVSFRGKSKQQAAWSIGAGGLSIEWGGTTVDVGDSGDGSATALLEGKQMKDINKALPTTEEMEFSIERDAMRFGTLRFPAKVQAEPPTPMVVPARPDFIELLLIPKKYSPNDVEWSTASANVYSAGQRMDKLIAEAAKVLEPFGIGEDAVAKLVDNHLESLLKSGGRPAVGRSDREQPTPRGERADQPSLFGVKKPE